jgi:AICAR transformylase/IMP cyclohydrolase PurH
MFKKLHGKELSYNNFDVDAAVNLINEFKADDLLAILKHTMLVAC